VSDSLDPRSDASIGMQQTRSPQSSEEEPAGSEPKSISEPDVKCLNPFLQKRKIRAWERLLTPIISVVADAPDLWRKPRAGPKHNSSLTRVAEDEDSYDWGVEFSDSATESDSDQDSDSLWSPEEEKPVERTVPKWLLEKCEHKSAILGTGLDGTVWKIHVQTATAVEQQYRPFWTSKVEEFEPGIYALKVMTNDEQTLDEEKLLRKVSSEHVNKLICSWEHKKNRYLLLEYAELSLQDRLLHEDKLRNYITLKWVVNVFRDVARGLKCLHDNGIVHKDLHRGNICVVNDGGRWIAKIIDLGKAREFQSGKLTPKDTDDMEYDIRRMKGDGLEYVIRRIPGFQNKNENLLEDISVYTKMYFPDQDTSAGSLWDQFINPPARERGRIDYFLDLLERLSKTFDET